ncbi:MAG: hypothetical protein JWM20_259 [Patescibacteria group bacterium]|nr:hypothetical protein [Patescibacteria group bacterium]
MKKLTLTVIVLVSLCSAQAQIAFKATTSRDAVALGSKKVDHFKFYTHEVDTTYEDADLQTLQMYLDGDIVIQEVPDKSENIKGKRKEMVTVKYKDGTKGKVMEIESKSDKVYKKSYDELGNVVDSTLVGTRNYRILLVSFATKDGADILVPFSPVSPSAANSTISGDEQFTTTHVVSDSKYVYILEDKKYLISGSGTLKYEAAKLKAKKGNGRRYDQ